MLKAYRSRQFGVKDKAQSAHHIPLLAIIDGSGIVIGVIVSIPKSFASWVLGAGLSCGIS
jgi:hypothetical protein